jgi:hypothetical protein
MHYTTKNSVKRTRIGYLAPLNVKSTRKMGLVPHATIESGTRYPVRTVNYGVPHRKWWFQATKKGYQIGFSLGTLYIYTGT